MKRAPVTPLVESRKRSRRDDESDSESSEEPLKGSQATKRPEELKAITWKLCEPSPVTVADRDSRIAVDGNTVYIASGYSNTLYVFNADKGKCHRKSFGLAVINGDLTIVGGESLIGNSNLKTLTSFVKRSGTNWIQKYPPMDELRSSKSFLMQQ